MQLKFDEKLNKIDRLYVNVDKLVADYENLCSEDDPQEGIQVCIADVKEIKEACKETPLGLETFLDNLLGVFSMPETLENSQAIIHILKSMQQKCKKAYLACMYNEETYKHVKLENYFGTAYERTALIVYIVYPFLFPQASLGHTNQQEAKAMAELLKEYHYNVDIVNTRYADAIDAEGYDFIIGSGMVFEKLCAGKGQETTAIYYLTEASPYFGNVAEMQRLENFWKRNHCRLPYERQNRTCLDLNVLAKADAAISIGNKWTLSTYEGMFPRIYSLNVSGFLSSVQPDFDNDALEIRKHFMWYGGAGPVHKGLDLCIEAFRKMPDLTLHIVGEPNAKFYDFYRRDIEEAENIYYYGFLNKDSEEFAEACRVCAYCISPSCSEGQSTSVLTAMHAGMIPVCTVQTGIDLEKCGGTWIDDIEVDAIIELIRNLSNLPPEEVKRRRMEAYEYVGQNHTLECYKENLKRILGDVIAKKRSAQE